MEWEKIFSFKAGFFVSSDLPMALGLPLTHWFMWLMNNTIVNTHTFHGDMNLFLLDASTGAQSSVRGNCVFSFSRPCQTCFLRSSSHVSLWAVWRGKNCIWETFSIITSFFLSITVVHRIVHSPQKYYDCGEMLQNPLFIMRKEENKMSAYREMISKSQCTCGTIAGQ